MIPMSGVLWWLSGMAGNLQPDDLDSLHPTALYLRWGALFTALSGVMIVVGAAVMSKQPKISRIFLLTGCLAVVLLSIAPVWQLINANPGALWMVVICAAWMVFAMPFIALTIFLYHHKQRVE